MKVKKLTIDTNALIARVPLWEYAEELFTIVEVIQEMKGSQARQYLDSFPIEIKLRTPSAESIKFIIDFSKKTGDYVTLSLVDTKLLALTYELEKDAHNGTSHLKTEPDITTHISASIRPPPANNTELPEGFYYPSRQRNENSFTSTDIDENSENLNIEKNINLQEQCDKEDITEALPVDNYEIDDQQENSNCPSNPDEIDESPIIPISKTYTISESEKSDSHVSIDSQFDLHEHDWSSESDEDEESEDCSDDDDEGWITPGNIHKFSRSQNMEELANIEVACMTTDYAMQNTLRHIGIEVIGFDGKLMKHKKTYTLRCFACYKTTNKMDKVFCPFCGHKTLRKVTVSVDENGDQKIWLSTKALLNKRGTKFPIPSPRGGKDAVNPILVADQRIVRQKLSKKTMKKMNMNPLNEDYVAGDRPFGVRDVFSKFAQLGITPGRNHRGTYYFEQRNPNEVKRSTVRMKKSKN